MGDERREKLVLWFNEIGIDDVPLVGGKNASLGEMYQHLTERGVRVPNGFAVTAKAYFHLLDSNGARGKVKEIMTGLNHRSMHDLQDRGNRVRDLILGLRFPDDLREAIVRNYRLLSDQYGGGDVDTAVRSSATAEDLPDASFAGQQETLLNVHGESAVLQACRQCFASLFTNRAIAYREEKGFDHLSIGLSICVQKMVRSDLACSGVMFSIDTESGFPDAVFITAAYGLGENVVQGAVNPDEYYVFKPTLMERRAEGAEEESGGPAADNDGFRYQPIIGKELGSKAMRMVYAVGGGKAVKNVPVPQEDQAVYACTDEEILRLARWAVIIEEHYSERAGYRKPMDIEWALDGKTGHLFIVQARPETVFSQRRQNVFQTWRLKGPTLPRLREEERVGQRRRGSSPSLVQRGGGSGHAAAAEDGGAAAAAAPEPAAEGTLLLTGHSVGAKIGAGEVCVVRDVQQIDQFRKGAILVTEMTDPDWAPIMKQAAAIVTNSGGRTCHAAIVSRELGIPCVVGTREATELLWEGQDITVDCSQGAEGMVYQGQLSYEVEETNLEEVPETRTKIGVILGTPDNAFDFAQRIPANGGVGLARMEFIINSYIKVHPLALCDWPAIKGEPDYEVVRRIDDMTQGYVDKTQYFVDKLSYGVARIAAAYYPRQVIVRMSDFKTNEYANLLGGRGYEPQEDNPMLGWRGASRYYDPEYERGFALECRAMLRVRQDFGLTNLVVMIPFCRTLEEGRRVLDTMARHGLRQGENGLQVYAMCEIPANVILADQFLDIFDGFSIGSNDLTQLVLGMDRDSGKISHIGNEENLAVQSFIAQAIAVARRKGKYIGICGQGPSDFPDFAAFLVRQGISSISLNPDTVMKTTLAIAAIEAEMDAET